MRHIKSFNESFAFNGTFVDVSRNKPANSNILEDFRNSKMKRLQVSDTDKKYIGRIHVKLEIPFHRCSEVQEDGECYDYYYRKSSDNSNVPPYLLIHFEKFTNYWYFICVTLKGCEKKMYICNEVEGILDLYKDLKGRNIFQ